MSRKIIIPKGLVDDTNQNSIIELSARLTGSRGNLIAKRQGKKLVAQQLPDWQDALSSAGPSDQMANNTYVASPAGCRPYQENAEDDTQYYSQIESEPTQYHSALNATYNVPSQGGQSCVCRPQDEYPDWFQPQTQSTPVPSRGAVRSANRTFITAPGAGHDQTYTYPGTPRPQNVTYAASRNDQTLTNANETYSVNSSPVNQTVVCPRTSSAANRTYAANPQGRNDQTFAYPKSPGPNPSWFQPNAQSTPAQSRGGAVPSNRTYVAAQGSRQNQTYTCPASQTFTVPPSNQRGRADQTYTYPGAPRPANQTYTASPRNQTYAAQPRNQTFTRPAQPPRADQTYSASSNNQLDGCRCLPQTNEPADNYPDPYGGNATYDVNETGICACESPFDETSGASSRDSRARSPSQTLPRAPARRTGRTRPGEETFPRSANRSMLEEHSTCPPCEDVSGIEPTDESYENRFQPVWTSSWNSLTDLDSQEVTEMEECTDQCGVQ